VLRREIATRREERLYYRAAIENANSTKKMHTNVFYILLRLIVTHLMILKDISTHRDAYRENV
jgi:hypothetical protein